MRKKDTELTAFRKQQEKQLREQGDYKTLSEQLATENAELPALRDEAQRYRESVEASNEQRVERLPEHMRGVVPSEYSPDQLSRWLDSNLAKLTAPPIPNLDAGAGGVSGGRRKTTKVTDLDRQQAEFAKDAGFPVDPEKLAARRKSGIKTVTDKDL